MSIPTRRITALTLASVLAMLVACSNKQAATGPSESAVSSASPSGGTGPRFDERALTAKARLVVKDLFAHDFAPVRAEFDPKMKAGLTESGLRKAQDQYEGIYGSLRTQGKAKTVSCPPYLVVNIELD